MECDEKLCDLTMKWGRWCTHTEGACFIYVDLTLKLTFILIQVTAYYNYVPGIPTLQQTLELVMCCHKIYLPIWMCRWITCQVLWIL